MNSIVYAAAATAIALVVGGLAAFAVADSARIAAPRRLDPAPARRLGGDARPRLPHRVRHAAARLPSGAVDRPGRPGARRDPLRRADRRSDAALDRRRISARPQRCSAPRPGECAARSTCRSSRAGSPSPPASRSRSRSASSARPCSSRGPIARRCPSRSSASSGRPGELNVARGVRARGRPHGRDGRLGAPRRARTRAARRLVLAMLRVGGRQRSLRRRSRARRRIARRRRRRGRHGPRAERLREDDAAPGRSPAFSGRTRAESCSTARPRGRATAPTRHRPRLPGPRALPAPRRLRQRRVRAAHARRLAGADRSADRELLELVGLAGLRAALGRDALRRRAAARRARSRTRSRASRPPAGRAARLARPPTPRSAARRSRPHLRRARVDRGLRHARPDGGVRARRSRRGHARRTRRPDRRRRTSSGRTHTTRTSRASSGSRTSRGAEVDPARKR